MPWQSIKIALNFLLVILLGSIAVLGLRVLLVRLEIDEMLAQAISVTAVCLAAGAFFWLGGLNWLGMDSPDSRRFALVVCLSLAGRSLTEYILRLAGLKEIIADILAIAIWLVTVLMVIYWLEKKQGNKANL